MKIFTIKILTFLYNELITHLPSRTVRKCFLRAILKKLGKNTSILMHTKFMNPRGISIEDGAAINQYCILDGRGSPLTIGKNADIATHTHLWTLEHDPHSNDHTTRTKPVTVGPNAWIASRCTILPGVTIGRACVIACGSVVTKNTDPFTIYGGIPAKKLSDRRSLGDYKLKFNHWLR